ncbi:uncharacterized protein AB675_9065 [Cyphellophora attinorum]|uniref:CENP-V/GFA domain-containing protein n=1 Tax=Cyphellophora attinorum TaxID=1664694 RepID=A0A0N0NNR5_9EURO|nr:uncharacterized protein AB675_9065 [Phialophora attinorum]KPI41689.1 hypothetical protein AB675_9065 [Phialophora attinorum]
MPSPSTSSRRSAETLAPTYPPKAPSPLFTGRCFCALTTFAVTALPTRSYICHCTDCRQFSGSSFHHMAVFPASSVTITTLQSSPKLFPAIAGLSIGSSITAFGEPGHGTRQFCTKCGSSLFMTVPDSIEEMRGSVIIGVGSIDGSESDERLRPRYEGFCKRREAWMREVEGAVESEEW